MSVEPTSLPKVRGRLRHGEPLSRFSWFKVGGPAAVLFQPADCADLQQFLVTLQSTVPVTVLGVGSNVLVRDGGLEQIVVRTPGALASATVERNQLIVEAGVLDQRVAQLALRAGLSGLEFMIGIPGTVGGAVRMNAGAFGGETAERLVWAEGLDQDGNLHRLIAAELNFSYRSSALPEGLIVVRAAFALVEGDTASIANRMRQIKEERADAQPLGVATGGSTFKNQPGHRAWQLIDEAGCRGLRRGQAMVSEKHCNFLVNLGEATAA
ncbi:MAG: UDP-N-acetylmuramate dehydrogenase, partial [Pseudomonadota bacterium]